MPCSATSSRMLLRALTGSPDRFQVVIKHPGALDLCLASFNQESAMVYTDSCRWALRL